MLHCLGHPGPSILATLRQNHFIFCNKLKLFFGHSCPFGKHTKLPFTSSVTSTHFPFDIVYSDIWTSPVPSSTGHHYYILFLNDFTNYWWTFPLYHKSQVSSIFIKFHAYIVTQFDMSIKNIQCDNGKEYANNHFLNFCASKGIHIRFSYPYTSPQNGKVDFKIRSINNIIHTSLSCFSLMFLSLYLFGFMLSKWPLIY